MAVSYTHLDVYKRQLTILVQVFLTRWLLRRHGVAPLLLLPAIAILIGFSLLTLSPLPILVAIVQVVTRAGEFSLAKPARETLYTRVDRESRYKATVSYTHLIGYRAREAEPDCLDVA